MNRHSLITIITLFYALIVGAINLLLYFQYNEQLRQEAQREVRHYLDILFHPAQKGAVPPPPRGEPIPPLHMEELATRLPHYGLKVSTRSIEELRHGRVIDESPSHLLSHLDGKRYFALFRFERADWLIIEDPTSPLNGQLLWLGLFISVNTLLLFFYLFLYRKLTPLHRLKSAIHRFANGDTDIDTTMKGKDEISEVANAFNQAIIKIRTLQESRNLFLRNIMHELKTPIAKGKITVDMFDDSKYKARLVKSFERLEFLLNEFAKVEQITSGYFQIKRHSFRVMDLLDHAVDLLHIDPSSLKIRYDNTRLDVDFELFSTALRNLVDNAFRYGFGQPEIIVKKGAIRIINRGKPLEKPFDTYLHPFNRAYESNATQGLGLGLYITSNIIKRHGMELIHDYDAETSRHIFLIR